MFSKYSQSQSEKEEFKGYLEAISASFCPYIVASQERLTFSTTAFKVCSPTIFCERGFIALHAFRETYRFIERCRHLPTPELRFLCMNLLFYTDEEKEELDWRLSIGLVHWLVKERFSKFGIIFGKFWPGENLRSKGDTAVPNPPCGILSIRNGHPTRDPQFFSKAPELLEEFMDYHKYPSEYNEDPVYHQIMSADDVELMSKLVDDSALRWGIESGIDIEESPFVMQR